MKFENHEHNCNIVVLTDKGNEYRIYANWLHNQNIDYFKDWHCEAGRQRIFIDVNSDVYSGECQNSLLGNLDSGWDLLEEDDAICHRTRCTGCTGDLLTYKYK